MLLLVRIPLYGFSEAYISPFFFIGGVVGGLLALIALALLAFCYPRRRRTPPIPREPPVNIFYDDASPPAAPRHYMPEPFLVPDPTMGGAYGVASTGDRPLSMNTGNTQTPMSMTAMTSSTRESGSFAQMRPLNIIRHDDAGPSEWRSGVGGPETMELPPTYANMLSAQYSPSTASTSISASIPAPTKRM